MNKILIRLVASLVLVSPIIAVSSIFKEVFYIIAALIILGATVDISKKKKVLETDPNN